MNEEYRKWSCIICKRHIESHVAWICRQCLKPCEVYTSRILEEKKDKMFIDVKSKCCNADVQSVGRMTCSENCHEEFIKFCEKEYGIVKKVVDDTTGISYKVPTRDIVEKGLYWKDLNKYPQWDENDVI